MTCAVHSPLSHVTSAWFLRRHLPRDQRGMNSRRHRSAAVSRVVVRSRASHAGWRVDLADCSRWTRLGSWQVVFCFFSSHICNTPSHAHTPELEASTPSPKCACLTGTDPSAGLRRGRRRRSGPKLGRRRSRDTISLIARKSRTPPARSTPGSPCCVCPARRDAWLACAKPRPRKPHVAREHTTTPHKKIDHHHHQRSGPPGRHNCPEASAWARTHVKGTQRRSNATAVKTTWPAKALC